MDEIKRRVRPIQETAVSTVKQPKKVASVSQQEKPLFKYELSKAREDIRTKSYKKLFNNTRKTLTSHWKDVLIMAFVLILAGVTINYRIGELTGGVSLAEQQYIASVNSGKEILENPSYLLHKLPTYILFKLGSDSISHYRMVSGAFAFLAVFSFYNILRFWYSKRVSVFATILFITSPWLLHAARLATPDATILLFLPLLWAAVWMYSTSKLRTSVILLVIIGILSLYIPGFFWIILSLSIWKHKTIIIELKQLSLTVRSLLVLAITIGISPLIYASINHPVELLLIAGLPSDFPSISVILTNIVNLPKFLFISGPINPLINVGTAPLIDLFSTVLLVFGIYSLRYHVKLIRAQIIFVSLILFAALIISGGPVGMVSILPIIYLLIAGGIAFMLTQWFVIFPRNPLARSIAMTVMSALVIVVTIYQTTNYFVAWANSPDTRSTFSYSLLK